MFRHASRVLLTLMLALLPVATVLAAESTASEGSGTTDASGGPIRLRQSTAGGREMLPLAAPSEVPAAPYQPSEFEQFVQRQIGVTGDIRRLGADLMAGATDGRAADLSPLVPAEYAVGPGDEVLVTIWGSVDADLRLVVDRAGRITIPRVGTVQVSGTKYGDLRDLVARKVGQTFKNFELSVSLGQLRGIRVFVTGFVLRPGAHTVSSLSTILSALMRAGGPNASGSFRDVELRRGGKLVSTFDLYDLVVRGDRSADLILQAGDVVHVPAVGAQVGVVGSVNKQCVVEVKPGETLADVLQMAGGFSAVADRGRVLVERLRERTSTRVREILLPGGASQALDSGDLVRVFSAVDVAVPAQQQRKRVRVEGEVVHPSDYVLPEGSTIADALRAAGGLTPNAFVYATEFSRESVRQSQQVNYDRALRDLETELARANANTRRNAAADEVAQAAARNADSARLVERLRALRPSGRVVLQLEPDSTELPDLVLEDGDRIYVPARSTTVGVFGSVFNAASYLYSKGRTLDDYLRLAGGPTKGADNSSVFVVRANGNVVSARQGSSWFGGSNVVGALPAQPGDTVFVPEELDKATFVQIAKDWTQILYQFGVGVAGLKSAFR